MTGCQTTGNAQNTIKMTPRFLLPALALSLALPTLKAAEELPNVSYEKFASGFVSPLSMIPYGEGEQAYLVVDQTGVIHFLDDRRENLLKFMGLHWLTEEMSHYVNKF